MQPVMLVTGGSKRDGAAVARLAAVPAVNERGPLPAVRKAAARVATDRGRAGRAIVNVASAAAAHVSGAIGSVSGAR